MSIFRGPRLCRLRTRKAGHVPPFRNLHAGFEIAVFGFPLRADHPAFDHTALQNARWNPGDQMQRAAGDPVIVVVAIAFPFVAQMIQSAVIRGVARVEFAAKIIEAQNVRPEIPILAQVIMLPRQSAAAPERPRLSARTPTRRLSPRARERPMRGDWKDNGGFVSHQLLLSRCPG